MSEQTPDVIDILRQLVRIPSVNPMGDTSCAESQHFESPISDYLEDFFRRYGIRCERHTVQPQRDNVIARLDGTADGPLDESILLWEVHQDTVPIEGMTIDPFAAELRDQRVYGRGACDVKGSMACMLAALARLGRQPPPSMPTIVMACTVNEEFGFTGAQALVKLWCDGTSKLLARRPDAAIVAEPTELNVVVAHKGVMRWQCRTTGVAAHSSTPQHGSNAIYKMARVVQALEDYATNILPALQRHPLLGTPTLSVGRIAGGLSVNTIPDSCTAEIDRRLLPGEEPESARLHAVQYVADQCKFEPQHGPVQKSCVGLSPAKNQQLAGRLAEVARDSGVSCELVGVPYATNAGVISSNDIPTVVFGPGSIQQAHTSDEWIATEQLHAATEIFCEVARRGLTVARRGVSSAGDNPIR